METYLNESRNEDANSDKCVIVDDSHDATLELRLVVEVRVAVISAWY